MKALAVAALMVVCAAPLAAQQRAVTPKPGRLACESVQLLAQAEATARKAGLDRYRQWVRGIAGVCDEVPSSAELLASPTDQRATGKSVVAVRSSAWEGERYMFREDLQWAPN